jgi:hypothetical protein
LRAYDGEVSGTLALSLEALAETVRSILNITPVPQDLTSFVGYRESSFAITEYSAKVVFPGGQSEERQFGGIMEFTEWEARANASFFGGRGELAAALSADPVLSQIVRPEELQGDDRTRLAILNRALRTPTWLKFAPTIGGQTFSIHDSIFFVASFGVTAQGNLGAVTEITMVPSEGDDQYPFIIRKLEIPDLEPFLDLLAEILVLLPSCDCMCRVLSEVLMFRLSVPDITIAKWSFPISIIWAHPFAFSLDVRILVFKLTAFNARAVLDLQHEAFGNPSPGVAQIRIPCHVDRERIFEQGVIIFERFGPGRALPLIHLENAHGTGPTLEFFTVFSHEFCRASRGLWRNFPMPDSEFVDPGELGLFPRPAADPHMFYIMGIMCAKALCIGCFISIPFNPVFFEIAWGVVDETTCLEIDPVLVHNLRAKEGMEGCVFVSPDIDAEELVPDGCLTDVTPENVDDYVRLVEERMICSEQAAAFAKGFGTALPWEATHLFLPDEFVRLLIGTQVEPFTLAGLEECVEVSHGYDAQSRQVRWFFNVLTELDAHQRQNFMLFLTGMRFASPSGLRGLKPPLTIACAVSSQSVADDLLPSVSTCAHYFKLPRYSSHEVLKERFLVAIEKGCSGFAFE